MIIVKKSRWLLLDVMDRIPTIFVSRSSGSTSLLASQNSLPLASPSKLQLYRCKKQWHLLLVTILSALEVSCLIKIPQLPQTDFFVYIWSTAQCINDNIEGSMTSPPL